MGQFHRLLGGILMVSGTTIGAGMLALPIVTGFAGFWPSISLFLAYWLYLTFTAFLMLEVNLWMEEHTNLITMARRTLGRGGKIVSWMIYLFLLYALTTAYLAGGGPIFFEAIEALTGWLAPEWLTPFPLLILFGFFVYQGARSVDYVNRLLMLGLAISYVCMVLFLTPYVDRSLLQAADWSMLWVAVSIVSTSFGFHIIIPTLSDYFQRDVGQLKKVLVIGSLIPLIIYVSWEFLTLGIIPVLGKNGVLEGYQEGLDGATLLSEYLGKKDLGFLSRLFSLFAIITSFLGVSLSLRDFLADGLNIKKTAQGKVVLYFLTFLPPLAITLSDPRAFLNALQYAGAFGVVTLLGLMPILMVWRGRYVQHREGPYRVPGGQWALAIALVISLGVIAFEMGIKTGVISLSITENMETS
jgi:tyrosine-specific transport protein